MRMAKSNKDIGQEQLLKEITTLLQKAHISYMVTGSVSVIFYGRPRASHDIDFVIEAQKEDIDKITNTFVSLPQNIFIVDTSAIADAVVHKRMFNILHLPTMLKLDFWLLQDNAFDRQRFKRRRNLQVFGQQMTFASPEDTILKKLLWYRESKIEKHLIDAAFVYQIQEKNLDIAYLNKWAKKHNTAQLLKEITSMDLEAHY